MAENKNRIRVRRGTNEKLVQNESGLVEGQPVYNTTDNYLTIATNEDYKVNKPITVREVVGYHGDESILKINVAKGKRYYFGSQEGTDYLIIEDEGEHPIVVKNTKGQITLLDAEGNTKLAAEKKLFVNDISGYENDPVNIISKIIANKGISIKGGLTVEEGNSALKTLSTSGKTTLTNSKVVVEENKTIINNEVDMKTKATIRGGLDITGKTTSDTLEIKDNGDFGSIKVKDSADPNTVTFDVSNKGEVEAKKITVVDTTISNTLTFNEAKGETLKVKKIIFNGE